MLAIQLYNNKNDNNNIIDIEKGNFKQRWNIVKKRNNNIQGNSNINKHNKVE
jgi:hypothetical protein